jgi:hypothetical protein
MIPPRRGGNARSTAGGVMNLTGLPLGVVDWTQLPATALPGLYKSAIGRASVHGDIQMRVVDYEAGYIADHWCDKGHILFVLSGELAIEHRDGPSFALAAGMMWHVGEAGFPPHRVVCPHGARVFIVD